MLERYPCYFSSHSKIRDIFDCSDPGSDLYFAKMYLLKLIENLQRGFHRGQYARFEDWRNIAIKVGFSDSVFNMEAWHMTTGDLALVEVEDKDDR